jgi:hypothetical protein
MSNRIRVHSAIGDDLADMVMKLAKDKKLDCIEYNKSYRLYKIGTKQDDTTVQPLNDRICVAQGEVRVVGNESSIALFISSLREWFRTSQIISCKKDSTSIIIETKNSVYELLEDV